MSATPLKKRPIRSEPKKGQMMPVRVATHVAGTLQFVSGALVQVTLSFDVPKHAICPIELYGTEASMLVPDPNMFGGEVKTRQAARRELGTMCRSRCLMPMRTTARWAWPTWRYGILNDRPHRARGELALHVLEVMEAFETASRSGATVKIRTKVERPAPI